MKLIVHKSNRESHWATIDLACLEDIRLSPLAKCIHVYVMTRPPGWDLRIEDLVRRLKSCRRTVQRALQELEKTGYIRREQAESTHCDGRHAYGEYIFYCFDQPSQNVQEIVKSQGAKSEGAQTEISQSELADNGAHSDNQSTKHQGSIDQERVCVEGYSVEFNAFWEAYPRKESRRGAWWCWNERLNGGATPEQMIRAAGHYTDYLKASKTQRRRWILMPTTFIGEQMRFEDWLNPREAEEDDDGRYERKHGAVSTEAKPGLRSQRPGECRAAGAVSEKSRELYRQAIHR